MLPTSSSMEMATPLTTSIYINASHDAEGIPHPPFGNSRDHSVERCHWCRRPTGRIPDGFSIIFFKRKTSKQEACHELSIATVSHSTNGPNYSRLQSNISDVSPWNIVELIYSPSSLMFVQSNTRVWPFIVCHTNGASQSGSLFHSYVHNTSHNVTSNFILAKASLFQQFVQLGTRTKIKSSELGWQLRFILKPSSSNWLILP